MHFRAGVLNMDKYLAFDIGGTLIKYGVVSEKGECFDHYLMDTEAHLGGPAIIQKVIQAGQRMLDQFKDIKGIAISSAGQIDVHKGTVIGAGDTIPNYKGLEIKKIVHKTLDLPVEVRNDVDCAALCELWLGEHQIKNFITITVGTGVGGAIIINRELFSGHTYSAGELGYMLVEGKQFENVASVAGLIEMVKQYKEDHEWTGKKIFEQYDAGDPKVKRAVKTFYKHLGIGISNLIYIFNPEKVIIGGGITERGEKFLHEVQEVVKQYTEPNIYANSKIVLAKHFNYSGMVGAVYNFLQRQGV